MDGQQFDLLTRRLASALPRRRVLRRFAGALAGAVLAGRAGDAQAEHRCPNGSFCPDGKVCCDGGCCDGPRPGDCGDVLVQCGYDCIDQSLAQCCTGSLIPGIYCQKPKTCCGVFTDNGSWFGTCCLKDEVCSVAYCMPPGSEPPCPSGMVECGSNCCGAGETCENGQCAIPCPNGATRCGTTCCTAGQTCDNGQCIAACPVGRAAKGVAAQAGCGPERCRVGQIKCGSACVPACKKLLLLNLKTCKCLKKCPRGTKECGTKCFDPKTAVCCDGAFAPPGADCCGKGHCPLGEQCCDDKRCCPPGHSCCGKGKGDCCPDGHQCCGKECCLPGEQCCDGKTCCPEGRRCCGETCCPEDQACANPVTGFCCPFGREGCGERCCANGEFCDQQHNRCCPSSHPVYCPKTGKCAIRRRDCP